VQLKTWLAANSLMDKVIHFEVNTNNPELPKVYNLDFLGSVFSKNKPEFTDFVNGNLKNKPLTENVNELQELLKKNPNNINIINSLAHVYLHNSKFDEAIVAFRQSLLIDPSQANIINNLGAALQSLNRFAEAILFFEDALKLKPDYLDALSNLALIRNNLRQFDAANDLYQRAVAINPKSQQAHFNLAFNYYCTKKFNLAENSYKEVLKLNTNHYNAAFHLASLYLLQGNFKDGLTLYETRWANKQAKEHVRKFTQPLWLGKPDLRGKTILIYAEQGFGDTLQFSRYLLSLLDLGATVLFEVQKPLMSLIKSISNKVQCFETGKVTANFDYQCPLLSLPLAFNTNLDSLPSKKNYLAPPKETTSHWQQLLGPKTLPRIGIAWTGSESHKRDCDRSIEMQKLMSLLSPKLEFHILQKDFRPKDKAALPIFSAIGKVFVHHQHIKDFSDTAALINEMDLVISVDTSIAHLAGSLGKEVWVLLPFLPDFRWLLDTEKSPWYPSAKLFRQPSWDNWQAVINDVKSALENQF
jgi:tetratricopeptide (TPR) repeat protein